MNCLAIDFGTKRIGLAYSLNNIIFTLPIVKNDNKIFEKISQIIVENKINKVYVGLSEGKISEMTKKFIKKLSGVIKLPIETVEEAVSTIEANNLFLENKKKLKNYQQEIDSIAAAIILNRVINS
ncbi:MAG TPA: Holliday junction resolvase RuvX [Candidatus Woesebacteria bacterium]|nr:Holliday junction resolvase RuvX [Candidatus Woesebacteria bacterium]HPR99202.1 Holliday junction resolvase RuvX [Candidatus Woesebacteria bacterium]